MKASVASQLSRGASFKLALMLPVMGLLLILFMVTRYQSLAADITPDEARLMWMVRDVVDIQPVAPREFARNVRENLNSVLDRSHATGTFPLYPLVLEGWTWLVGDSVEMARILNILIGLISLTLLYQLMRRLLPDLALLFMTGLGIVFALINLAEADRGFGLLLLAGFLLLLVILAHLMCKPRHAPALRWQLSWLSISAIVIIGLLISTSMLIGVRRGWQSAINPYLTTRNPLHPVLTTFTPDSVIGYYDYRYGLHRGVAVDLAWREFSPDEINTVVDKVLPGKTPVWIVMSLDDPELQQITTRLVDQNYTTGYSDQIANIVFYRFDPATSTD